MATFSVVLLTAIPTGLNEGAGAFVKIDGRESLLRSVEMFLNRANIKQIQLVVSEEQMEEAKRKYGGHLGFSGVKLLSASKSWLDQSAAAAEKIAEEATHVLVHDAARPAVAFSDIDAILAEAEKHPIVALTAPVRTNLVEIDDASKGVAFRQASKYLQIVTPWTFRKDRFLELAKNRREPAAGEVHFLRGLPHNVRVGHSGDAGMVKTMISMLPKPKMRAADNPFEEAQW